MADGYTSTGKITPEWWINQIARGKKFREQYAQESKWPTWRKWYRGDWKAGILPSNVYFKMIRTLIPRVYYRNPSISLTPTKPGLENMLLCKLFERIDNRLLEIMGVKPQMKRMVLNATMFGTAFARLGFGAEFTPTPDDISTSDPDTGGVRRKKRVEYNSLIHANVPWFLSSHPGNTIVPAGATDFQSARWVAFEYYRTRDDVLADPRFKDVDLATGVSEPRLVARNATPRDGVQLYEIRDKKTGMVFVLAPHAAEGLNGSGSKKVLFEDEDSLQINGGLPAYPLIFNQDDEVFWGIPDSQILEPQQIEKNEIRTQIMYHRRIALAKLLYEAGAITPDELSKLTDGNANGIVQVKNLNGIKELIAPGIPQGLLESEQIADREVQEILGMGTNQFGEYAPGSADRSATEANIVNQATMIRIDERRDTCADLLVDFTKDMNHVIVEHWDTDMVIDIAGPAGVPIWIKFQPKMLHEAFYDIKVDRDTSLPLTKAIREQKAVQTYGILKTNPLVQPQALTEFLLTEMYGVDADFLLGHPLFQSTEQNPLTLQQAAQHMQSLPQPNIEDMRSRMAQPVGGQP